MISPVTFYYKCYQYNCPFNRTVLSNFSPPKYKYLMAPVQLKLYKIIFLNKNPLTFKIKKIMKQWPFKQ